MLVKYFLSLYARKIFQRTIILLKARNYLVVGKTCNKILGDCF